MPRPGYHARSASPVSPAAPHGKDDLLARTNYSFERRQRDLAKKKKAEEKLARRIAKSKAKAEGREPAAAGEPTPAPSSEREA